MRDYGIIPDRPKRLRIVDTQEKVGKAVEHLLKFDLLGYDTETYHAFDRRTPAFNPCDGARMRLAQFATPEGDTYVFDLFKVNKSFLHYMFPNRFTCVIHNAKFELKFLMFEMGIYKFGPLFDTLVAEQVLSKGRVTGKDHLPVGLDKVAYRRLDIELPKTEQDSDWYKEELTRSQIEYAARDANVVLPIYQQQSAELVKMGLVRVAETEFDATLPIAWMENTGIRMAPDRWTAVCDGITKEIEQVKPKLWDILGQQHTLFSDIPTLNLASQPQVIEAFERIGVTVPVTPEGVPTLNNKLLADIKDSEAVSLYIKYVKLAKKLSAFGYNWVDKINPYSGRIHCNLKQIGAETGRMAAAFPNLMQIPKENLYRNCFEAEDGWVLIDNDYSQCELRILAEYCRDPNLLEAFDKGYDLHRYSAHLIYRKELDAVTDKERSVAKNLNFGIVYGIGAGKFANQAEISIEQAQEIMDFYLKRAYPKMGHWLEGRANAVVHSFIGTTMSGRIRKYAGDISDSQFKAQMQRNAKNLPIQGTNADITKLAMSLVYKRIVKEGLMNVVHMLLPIHDELLLEAHPRYALQASTLLQEEMLVAEQAYLKRVPSLVDGTITTRWYKSPDPDVPEDKADLDKAAQLINEAMK